LPSNEKVLLVYCKDGRGVLSTIISSVYTIIFGLGAPFFAEKKQFLQELISKNGKTELDIKINQELYWTDSQVVLSSR